MVTVFSPAKINLFLAVTGRRADGYHDLVSVVAQLDFGDDLAAKAHERGAGPQFTLECDGAGVPVDDTNLVIKAARSFALATGWNERVAFKLAKRIPPGAGLGGGSSNAVAALRALNQLAGWRLAEDKLGAVAATLGSDCALFLNPAPVVICGRGERVEPLAGAALGRLRGRRVLLFKPSFAISTAWAYGRMAVRGTDYLASAEAEARVAAWQQGGAPAGEILFNNMEGVAFDKFVALPVLLGKIRTEFGLAPRMSGSGSACFALLSDDFVTAPLVERIRHDWGPAAFVKEARII